MTKKLLSLVFVLFLAACASTGQHMSCKHCDAPCHCTHCEECQCDEECDCSEHKDEPCKICLESEKASAAARQ